MRRTMAQYMDCSKLRTRRKSLQEENADVKGLMDGLGTVYLISAHMNIARIFQMERSCSETRKYDATAVEDMQLSRHLTPS